MFCDADPYTLEWWQVRPLFEEYGRVWVDHPEMRWYEESWGAVMRDGLANTETDREESLSKLRAIALLYMYLGFCRSLDESINPDFSDMLQNLKIDLEALSMSDEEEDDDIPEAGSALTEAEGSNDELYNEDDSDQIREQLEGVAYESMRKEARAIYDALVEHYGDVNYLFVSLWNSRVPLYAVESASDVLSDAPLEKQNAFMYVTDEMAHV